MPPASLGLLKWPNPELPDGPQHQKAEGYHPPPSYPTGFRLRLLGAMLIAVGTFLLLCCYGTVRHAASTHGRVLVDVNPLVVPIYCARVRQRGRPAAVDPDRPFEVHHQ